MLIILLNWRQFIVSDKQPQENFKVSRTFIQCAEGRINFLEAL